MATAKELLDLYKSISDTDIDKQTEFSVILSKLFYMIEQNHAIDMSSKYTFDRNFAKYDNVMNERKNATGTVVRRLLKEQIARVISAFSNYDSKTRLQKIETKINAVIDYAENYRKSLPTIGDFQRVLSGSSASGAAAAAKAPLKPVAPRQQPMQSVIGTKPFDQLSEALKARCQTLEGLNEYIAGLYPGDRYSTPVGRQNVQAIVSTCRNPALRDFLGGWIPKNSHGYLQDCLIESFLTATCPAFRVLKQDHKDTVAENFRQLFFASQPEISQHRNSRRLLNEIRDHRFLGNEHLSILSEIYRVDFLMLEDRALGRAGATHFEINRSARVYIIINPDNAHYEAVQPRPGDEDYSISRDEAVSVVQCVNAKAIGEAERGRGTESLCQYPVGALVLYQRGQYRILKGSVGFSNTGQPSCEGYLIATDDNFRAYSDLPNSGRNGMRKENITLILRYAIPDNIRRSIHTGAIQPNYIPPAELSLLGAAAGPRTANAADLVAAGAPVRMAAAAAGNAARAAAAAAAAPPANNTNDIDPLNFAGDRNGYIGIMMSMPATQDLREYMTQQEIIGMYGSDWDTAWKRAGGRRIRRRTAKARRSLRAGRRTPSKGKGHGSRRKR